MIAVPSMTVSLKNSWKNSSGTYVTTGIYPVDNYYGIKATELMPIQALIAARRRAAEEKAKKYREASAKKRAIAQGKTKAPELAYIYKMRELF